LSEAKKLLSELTGVATQGPFDTSSRSQDVDSERKGTSFDALEEECRALIANDTAYDFGDFVFRIDLDWNAPKITSALQVV
jgi:hypothetical protein